MSLMTKLKWGQIAGFVLIVVGVIGIQQSKYWDLAQMVVPVALLLAGIALYAGCRLAAWLCEERQA